MNGLVDLLGEDPGILELRETVRQLLARSDRSGRHPPILLQGETGTGKGLVANLIHKGGPRRDGPFVEVNCAANEDLATAVRDRHFREDLYHRLAVITLSLPPLRDRREDIVLLSEHFLSRWCADYDLPLKALAPDAQAALLEYRWPGN